MFSQDDGGFFRIGVFVIAEALFFEILYCKERSVCRCGVRDIFVLQIAYRHECGSFFAKFPIGIIPIRIRSLRRKRYGKVCLFRQCAWSEGARRGGNRQRSCPAKFCRLGDCSGNFFFVRYWFREGCLLYQACQGMPAKPCTRACKNQEDDKERQRRSLAGKRYFFHGFVYVLCHELFCKATEIFYFDLNEFMKNAQIKHASVMRTIVPP